MTDPRLARHLGAVYFFYLAAVGLAVTWWPMHFEALGLTGAQIGLLFSVRTAINIVSQPSVTRLADHLGRPLLLLRIACIWGAIVPAGLLVFRSFWGLGLTMWISGVLTAAIVPLLDSTIVVRLGSGNFGRVRLWGSIGYGVCVAAFGWLMRDVDLAGTGRNAVIGWLALMSVGALLSLGLERRNPPAPRVVGAAPPPRGWVRAPLLVFLGINALHWYSVTAFNVYFALHVNARGHSSAIAGLAVGVGIVAEVLALALARRSLRADRAQWWFPLVFAGGVLRWITIALAHSAAVLSLVQLVNFLSYGIWVVVMMHMIDRFVPTERRTAAQGLMGGLTLGVGGMLGSSVSGVLLDAGGGQLVFLTAAAVEGAALLLFVAAWPWWRERAAHQMGPRSDTGDSADTRDPNPEGAPG